MSGIDGQRGGRSDVPGKPAKKIAGIAAF